MALLKSYLCDQIISYDQDYFLKTHLVYISLVSHSWNSTNWLMNALSFTFAISRFFYPKEASSSRSKFHRIVLCQSSSHATSVAYPCILSQSVLDLFLEAKTDESHDTGTSTQLLQLNLKQFILYLITNQISWIKVY